MTSETFSSAIRNRARGRATYRHARHRIFQAAKRNGSGPSEELSTFLRDQLLKLRKGEWYALAFDEKDWKALDVIGADETGVWARRYLPLVLDYIAANSARIQQLYALNIRAGSAMLNDDGDEANSIATSFSHDDEQSLFAFRLFAAQYSYDADGLVAILQQRLKTDWLRKRYLYPLVYQSINAPPETSMREFISFVVSGDEQDSERATLQILLRDDLLEQGSLAFKCYVSLLCHPYDAYEMLLNEIEAVLAGSDPLPAELQMALSRVHEDAPTARTEHLRKVAQPNSLQFQDQVDEVWLSSQYGISQDVARVIAKVASLNSPLDDIDLPSLSKPLSALVRMRSSRYPQPEDFNYLVHAGRSWWFCEGGRLVNALMTSLYMVLRREPAYELRDALRLIGFFGAGTPFVVTSPSAMSGHSLRLGDVWRDFSASEIEIRTEAVVSSLESDRDRTWIKAVHWRLREPEQRMLISRWLATVRSEIRIAPAYLTGIDWSWLESVIKLSRLRPFVGNPTGIYALLLFKIELQDRLSSALRTAFEPLVEGRTLSEVVDYLIEEYDAEATAFVRYLLEADDLLWLGLAPNRTAALAGRIYALERCVKRFKYSDILPQSLFEQEWNSLNSALLLMSVNAGQFEIPWSMFIKDAAARQLDLYTAAHSLEPGIDMSPLLTAGRTTSPYKYRNGKVITYTYPGRLTPVASLIFAVVEDFLAHPAFGLEVILSTRFRHDTMKREFAATLESVGDMSIQGVWKVDRRAIVEEIEEPVLASLEDWLNRRMHTDRPGKAEALFDILPTPQDLIDLAQSLKLNSGVDKVISEIVRWLQCRLEEQLPHARAAFELEVPAALEAALNREKARLIEGRQHRVSDVERVIAAAHNALDRTARDLREWFRGCPENARPPLTLKEVKSAADGLFEAYKERRGYRARFADSKEMNREIASDMVRTNFDLFRETFSAALKHSGDCAASIRIRSWEGDGSAGLMISNLTEDRCSASTSNYLGDPYTSIDDVIFREGNSGLSKIAAIAATIRGSPVTVRAVRRRGAFHVIIPLWEH